MDDRALVARLLDVADAFDENDWTAGSGVLRVAARRLAELSPQQPLGGACPTCGGEVVQPPVGRRRSYCVGCSPLRKTRGKLHAGRDD